MYKFGKRSTANLDTADIRLQELANYVIKYVDHSIIQGHRTREEHEENLRKKTTTVAYERSAHSHNPSLAIDVLPYPFSGDWNSSKTLQRFAWLTGHYRAAGYALSIPVKIGIDWDMDGDITDHNFMDYPHIELIL